MSDIAHDLILRYFNAFSNLYGIISLKRALRIITEQNPDLDLSPEQFYAIANTIATQEKCFFSILDEHELDPDVPAADSPAKLLLVAEHLTTFELDDYLALREAQEGRRFYLPEREELLRFEDDVYLEPTPATEALRAFLQSTFSLSGERLEDALFDMIGSINIDPPEDDDFDFAVDTLSRIDRRHLLQKKPELLSTLHDLYTDLRRHTRRHVFRGHTAAEVCVNID